MKIKVDVETMKPAEHNTQNRTLVSATESGGSPVLRHQERSVVPVSSEHAQSLSTRAEVLQVADGLPSKEEVLRVVASKCLQIAPPRCKDDYDKFLAYLETVKRVLTGRIFCDNS